MICPNCSSPIADGTSVCPSCQHVLGTTPKTAIGALTPPDGLEPQFVGSAQVDELAQRLQAAVGDAYAVEKTLGAGGFAVVYLVRDLNLKRRLAVKVLSPDLITSKTVLERFRREAETVAQLSHPHIVPLHFIGQKDDLLYLAMECIDGGSLADRVDREKRLPIEDVTRIVSEVASALAYAHKRGVVHRDIKPHNVLIESETGRTLVTDFGIARTAEGSSLTASGMMVGTPAYLSPEQVTGGVSDHRADIYALGIMTYEMLAGEPPFTGPTPTAVLMKRLSGTPPAIGKVRGEVPQFLRDALDGMLAQNPEDRFQSAADVVRALGGGTPASGGHSTTEFRLKSRQNKFKRNAMISAIAAAVVTAVAWIALRPGAAPVTVARVDADMRVIPGGEYLIGSDNGPPMSRPAHRVSVDSFGIDAREVSVGEYAAFMSARGMQAPWGTGAQPDSLLPVTRVNYSEALNYCAWKHGTNASLPSEDQWEAAARGLTARIYPWGETMQPGRAKTASESPGTPSHVGAHPLGATPEGLQDMVGNVWEWTSSPMGAYPGAAPIRDVAQYYVIRGGAYDTPDATASPVLRGYLPPSADRAYLDKTGFRCVMPLRRTPGSR